MPWEDGIDRSPYKYGPREIMQREEVGQMLEKADLTRDKCLIVIHYLTGARVSEIVELKRNNITISSDELKIRFKRRKRRDEGPLIKTDRLIFSCENELTHVIIDYVSEFDGEDYLFPSPGGGHLTRQRVWQIIKDLNPDVSSHFFRHTRLNKLSRKGFSLEDLRKWSGRKTQPTEYMEISEKDIRKIGKKID